MNQQTHAQDTREMSATRSQPQSLAELETTIAKALAKVGSKKENDLCRYLPMSSGGYMHHFTLQKMKRRDPEQLRSLIQQFILQSEAPRTVHPKQRAPRGSKKRRDPYALTRTQLEKMFQLAKETCNREMLLLLSPRRSLAACKKDLISSIRRGEVDQMLWEAYSEASKATQLALQDPSATLLSSALPADFSL